MAEQRLDEATGQTTVGHSYDGIEELNTPLPRWWLWTFYATIIWGIGYTIAFPAWPLISGATEGMLGYSTRGEVAEQIEVHEAKNASLVEQLVSADMSTLLPTDDIHRYGTARGASVFRAQCSQCHGSGAQGGVGYPNLLDNDWLWGGQLTQIEYTIRHGIRNDTDFDAHWSEMPAFGRDEILPEEDIELLAGYVQGLATGEPFEERARGLFLESCSSCHGENGLGDPELGAPNLADAIWLYGDDKDSIFESIYNARFGVMPAWGQRLSEADVRAVAIYVHGLGGGE